MKLLLMQLNLIMEIKNLNILSNRLIITLFVMIQLPINMSRNNICRFFTKDAYMMIYCA